ncbi:NAD(P)-binding protein [Dentipellis sp. KUC8613]|nr:NAD(P)-binding protein [Dentipellis sp. KUC8613]
MASAAASKNFASAAKYAAAGAPNPVAVFVGGTSGIGQGMAEAFNRHTKGNAHIVLVGRNEQAAQKVIAKMKAARSASTGSGSYTFAPCDISLLANVRHSAADILAAHPRVNFLVVTAGVLGANSPTTADGIDRTAALHYYSRWQFFHAMLPGLRAARDAGEDAKAVSVYSAGDGGGMDALANYNDLMCESFAERNPGIVFAHASPGAVRTNLLKASDSWLLHAIDVVLPLMRPITVSQDECGEYLWSGLYRAAASGGSGAVTGAFRIGSKGQELGMDRYYGSPEERRGVWSHTVKVTKTRDADP